MRLTLRTLLAYLDDILDPADKEELAHKIESSEFAEELVHRTRDTMRRLRLSAPQVVGTGMALDPNTVAEYLDNVLPPEQVGDYERICLESDVHLAEAAACHHVLTMVLGEPADVEPRSRQRMYMIPAEARERRRLRAEPAHTRGAAAARTPAAGAPVAAVASMAPAAQSTRGVEIPEYLRAKTWWRSRGALVALASVVIVGASIYFLSGMLGGSKDALDVAADKQESPTDVEVVAPEIEVATQETGVAPAEIIPTETTPLESPAPPAIGDRYPATEVTAPSQEQPGAPPAVVETAPVVPVETPSATNEQATATVVETRPVEAPAVEAPAANETAATVGTIPPTEVQPPGDADPSAALPPADVNTDVGATAAARPVEPGTTVEDAAQGVETTPVGPAVVGTGETTEPINIDESVPPGPPELGTYLSGKTVLLRYDEPTGGWFRVQPRSAVVAGQRLLALPEFRPQITLASGVMLELSGGTQVIVTGSDQAAAASDAPTIDVLYGRIVLINTSTADNRVRLKLGNNVGDARIKRNATLAVEVQQPFVPGNDPRTTPAPVVVRLFVPDGGVTWQDEQGEVAVDKPSRLTLASGAPAEIVDDSAPPEWIDGEPGANTSEARYGAPVVETTLVSDRPADIQLLELYKGNGRRELKSLATRSSIHVGLFAPFIDALRDSDQKWPTWRTHIDTLRSAMAYSPQTAEQIYQALVEQRGRSAADDLYEMLCGYNAQQIGTNQDDMKVGALKRLIDWLEDDSLDYRVLAVHDLWEITGKQLMPNPAAKLTVRKLNVRNWRSRLESGELKVVERTP